MSQIRSSEKKSPELYYLIAYIIIPPNFMQMTIEALTCFTFYFLGCICTTPKGACKVHPDWSFCNVDKTSQRKVFPSMTYSATVVIEFTATLGVMPVGKELVTAPKTLLGIHTVFGEKRVSAICYIVWENLGPSSWWCHGWGGTPYPPSDVIRLHVTCLDFDYT